MWNHIRWLLLLFALISNLYALYGIMDSPACDTMIVLKTLGLCD